MSIDSINTTELVDSIAVVASGMSWSKAATIALIFCACVAISKIVLAVLDRSLTQFKVERSLHTFFKSAARIALACTTVFILADYLGIQMGSLITLLGVAGLAVSLSIQGTLSNLAGGIMILVSKPFAVGNFIEAGEVLGVVADIGLVYTQVKTMDNKQIFVPNGQIAEAKIINYTSQTQRRVDLDFEIAYESDAEVAKKAILQVIGAHPKAVFTPEPYARVRGYGESSVKVTMRVWCATEDYWEVHDDMLEQVRVAFDKNNIQLTYNHLNVHIVEK